MKTAAVNGVLLDEADTRLVVDVLGYLGRVATENGRRPTPKVEALRRCLQSAYASVSARTVSDGASLSGPTRPRLLPEGYELVDTAQAARLLGTTADTVRYHARRGSLPAQRAGGRWLLDAAAVAAIAEQRARR